MTTASQQFLTPGQYFELESQSEDKHEYHDGEVFAMGGGTPEHSLILANLYYLLNRQLWERQCNLYTSESRLWVEAEGVYTYPDASVVCDEPRFDAHDNLMNPTALFEVLSPSTEAYDRGKKFDMYRTLETLQQYVLIAQEGARVYVFTRQEQSWRLNDAKGLESVALLESIRCELPLKELYHKVRFKPQPQKNPERPKG